MVSIAFFEWGGHKIDGYTSNMSSKKLNRKTFFKQAPKTFVQKLMKTPFGEVLDHNFQALGNLLAPSHMQVGLDEREMLKKLRPDLEKYFDSTKGPWLRPPGSLQSTSAFEAHCTQCGDCARACPYESIENIDGLGPLLNPNLRACHHCNGYPCIQACETGALVKLKKNQSPSFAKPKLLEQHCLNTRQAKGPYLSTKEQPKNFKVQSSLHVKRIDKKEMSVSPHKEIQKDIALKTPTVIESKSSTCKNCSEICPIEGALALLSKENDKPFFTDACTGCGMCREVCPSNPKAILLELLP